MSRKCLVPALVLLMLSTSGCFLVPKLRAGVAASGVISLSETVNTENPIMLDAFVRFDMPLFQLEAAYGQRTYTYNYEVATVTNEGELDMKPLSITARFAIGSPFDDGIRKKWVAGVGVVFSDADGDFASLDLESYDTYRVSCGHEWIAGKLLVLVEGSYEIARTFEVDDVTWDDAVDLDLSTFLTRIAVGYRF